MSSRAIVDILSTCIHEWSKSGRRTSSRMSLCERKKSDAGSTGRLSVSSIPTGGLASLPFSLKRVISSNLNVVHHGVRILSSVAFMQHEIPQV